ncbi:hypothetical protein FKM82_017322 [Ascaphus truei]
MAHPLQGAALQGVQLSVGLLTFLLDAPRPTDDQNDCYCGQDHYHCQRGSHRHNQQQVQVRCKPKGRMCNIHSELSHGNT